MTVAFESGGVVVERVGVHQVTTFGIQLQVEREIHMSLFELDSRWWHGYYHLPISVMMKVDSQERRRRQVTSLFRIARALNH